MTNIISRLWVSQIRSLTVGFHDRGLFEDIRVQDMHDEVAEWKENNEVSFGEEPTVYTLHMLD